MMKISENKRLSDLSKFGFTMYEDINGVLLSCEQDFESKYIVVNVQIDKEDRLVKIKEFPKCGPSHYPMPGIESLVKTLISLRERGYLVYDV